MRVFWVTLVLAFFGTSAWAEGYLCKMNSRARGFIPSIFAVDIRAGGTAAVIDDFIAALEKQPKIVTPKLTRKGELRMTWDLKMPTSEGSKVVRFRATLNEETRKVAMAATIRHASNHERGTGACQIGQLPKS